MRKPVMLIGSGAFLLILLLFLLGDPWKIAAVLLPIAFHELGHLLALKLLGLPLRGIRLELRGLCIEYGGSCGALSHAMAAAAGPLAGIAYAFAASRIGDRLGSGWLSLTSGISLLLSFFNLLPAMPLDGGRLLFHLSCAFLGEKRGKRFTEVVGLLVGAALLGGGFYLMIHGKGAALTLAAVWLLLSQEEGRGLVKRCEMI